MGDDGGREIKVEGAWTRRWDVNVNGQHVNTKVWRLSN